MCFVTMLALSLFPSSMAACDDDKVPYTEEASPFGWPISPNFAWDEQECWAPKYPFCAGVSQSPMDIKLNDPSSHCVTEMGSNTSALKDRATYWGQQDLTSLDWVQMGLPSDPVVRVSTYMRTVMAQGPFGKLNLKDSNGHDVEYEATQVHVTPHSLHTINGVHYDAEMLVMHRPKGAKDLLGGSVILSVLFSASDSAGSPIFDQMGVDSSREEEWTVNPFGIAETLNPALMGSSYQYSGSVPVPPCSETVTWYVMEAVQPISQAQLQHLKAVLTAQAGGFAKRSPIPRHIERTCRPIAVNGLQVSHHHEDATCAAAHAEGKDLELWACQSKDMHCGISPDLRFDNTQTGPRVPIEDAVHYSPTEHVTMTPSEMTLDGTVAHGGSFGHLMLNGRVFLAKTLKVKAISSHRFNGKWYAGELRIEHDLYGAADAGSAHGATAHPAEGHGATAHDAAANAHRRLADSVEAMRHRVTVTVPLKLGRESPLLRHLRLGQPAVSEAIRDGNSYEVHQAIDLSEELKTPLEGKWYWYRTAENSHDCGDMTMKWMVFETPLEVSIEQLNDLSLKVSGMDSTYTRPMEGAPALFQESFPAHAVEPVVGALGECKKPWNYKSTHCWVSNFSACAGIRQSPINIKAADITDQGQDNFLSKCSWKPVQGLEVTNSGRGLQVTNNQLGYFAYVGQDGFQEFYQVSGMKLHMPSEHMVDNKLFDAELQIVHQKQLAVNHLDEEDVAITSFFFSLGSQDSPILQQFHLPGHAVQEGAPTRMALPLDLMRALGPAIEGGYYRYDGSLTVPDCSEHTKWFVFETPMEMSQAQLSAFKALFPGAGNNRPVQELNGRRLARNSFMEGTLQQFDFYLNRHEGRNRSIWDRSTTLILIPIIFTVIFTIYVMASLFVREDRRRKGESAGGLTSGGGLDQPIGRQQPPYARF